MSTVTNHRYFTTQLENAIDYAETDFLRRSSHIWNYFWVKKGGHQAVCRRCHCEFNGVFRPGSYRAKFNNTRHLRLTHPDLYQEYIAAKCTLDTIHPSTVGHAYDLLLVV